MTTLVAVASSAEVAGMPGLDQDMILPSVRYAPSPRVLCQSAKPSVEGETFDLGARSLMMSERRELGEWAMVCGRMRIRMWVRMLSQGEAVVGTLDVFSPGSSPPDAQILRGTESLELWTRAMRSKRPLLTGSNAEANARSTQTRDQPRTLLG